MNHAAMAHQRLSNQQIAAPQAVQPCDVVAWLGAIQGQDYAGAKWSLGLRVAHSTDAAIERAIADGTIVRTWAMRGTLHLVAAADVRWLLALLAPRLIAASARRYTELELDEPTLARTTALLAQALAGGTQLNRPTLLALVEANGISTQGQRAAYILQRASLDGAICQGVAPRNVPVFVSLDAVAPRENILSRDDALATLAQRYIASRGPVALSDFVAWSGLPVGDARRGLALVEDQFARETIDGQTYWLSHQTVQPTAAARGVYLLPGFDEYLLGYRDRSATLDARYATRIVPGGNGIFMPTIVSDGRVVGTWKRLFKKATVVVASQPFRALSDEEYMGIEAAAAEYGRFVQMPVVHKKGIPQ